MSDFSIQPAGHGSPDFKVGAARNVSSLSRLSANGATHAQPLSRAASSETGGDRVELSQRAQFLAQMRDMPEVREDRINRVRGAIDRGVYETDDRINATIEQLIAQEDLLGG
jgi:flagellar biosynthesis anti-sigma factor FlgM